MFRRFFVSAFLVTALMAGSDVAAKPGGPVTDPGTAVRGISAGVELMAIIEFAETITFNEGVMEKQADRSAVNQDPARSEKWKFGDRFERFYYDGRIFGGLWRSARFQDDYFVEFIRLAGEFNPGRQSIKWMTLTRTRFDRTSLQPPVCRGYTRVSLRFEDLQINPGYGNSVSYRFVPGTSKVFINSAVADLLETNYHSETRTIWKGRRIDLGKNPVSNIPYEVFAEVTFETWPPPGPPLRVHTPSGGSADRIVTIVGDWDGLPEVVKDIGGLPGITVVDRSTKRVQPVEPVQPPEGEAVSADGQQAGDGGQPGDGQEPVELPREDLTQYNGVVLEVIATGKVPGDISARARIVNGDAENEMWLNVDYELFRQFGTDEFKEWLDLQGEAFRIELVEAVKSSAM